MFYEKKRRYNIAVLGATGMVGKKVMELIFDSERPFPVKTLQAVASQNSKGTQIKVNGTREEFFATTFEDLDLANIHVVFNALKSEITRQVMPQLLKSPAVIIDKSSLYRMEPWVPLIASGINDEISMLKGKKLIASPNCCVIPLVHVLGPLMDIYDIRRVTLATYQSSSGAGFAQMQSLQNNSIEKSLSDLQFNVIPRIGSIDKNTGSTEEEEKIIQETKKILNSDIAISVTSARVPVLIGHCICANIEFKEEVSMEKIRLALKKSEYVIEQEVITPKEVEGQDKVYVSRLRMDQSLKGMGISLWITSDNLRRGAATNAVEIAHKLIEYEII
jgi:aspartate-semialdehyde dehydrogenase